MKKQEKAKPFEVPITYRCDRECLYCDRLIGVIPWDGPDITLDDVQEGGRRVKEAGLKIKVLKITGGEPTLHPHLTELCYAFDEWVIEGGRLNISTNKTKREFKRVHAPGIPRVRLRRNPVKGLYNPNKRGRKGHHPNLISPVDVGIELDPNFTTRKCVVAHNCGASFDVYGFTICHHAGPLGRLLHIDPYSTHPVAELIPEICQHCHYSLPIDIQNQLFADVKKGKLLHPTPIFHKGLAHGPMQFKRFRAR